VELQLVLEEVVIMLFENHGIVLNFDLFQITGLMEEIIMLVDIEQQEGLIQ
jgi:hypothetical protein